jgi:hypothetical protein
MVFARQRRAEGRLAFVIFGGMVLGVLGLVATGCRHAADQTAGIVVDQQVSPQPARVGAETVRVQLKERSTGQAVGGARVSLEAEMSHPGMAPVLADASEIAPGKYEGRIQFSMAGSWVILLHITLPDGKKIEREIRVGNVRAS